MIAYEKDFIPSVFVAHYVHASPVADTAHLARYAGLPPLRCISGTFGVDEMDTLPGIS